MASSSMAWVHEGAVEGAGRSRLQARCRVHSGFPAPPAAAVPGQRRRHSSPPPSLSPPALHSCPPPARAVPVLLKVAAVLGGRRQARPVPVPVPVGRGAGVLVLVQLVPPSSSFDGSDGVAPGATDFELMLRAFGDRGQFDAVDEAFDEMLLRGLVPGMAVYNVYVAALWKMPAGLFAESLRAQNHPSCIPLELLSEGESFEFQYIEMEIELDSPSRPAAAPAPMPRSGEIAATDETAPLPPPPSRHGPASPSPAVPSPEGVLPLSPLCDGPARRRRSKLTRSAAVVDQGAGPVGSPRKKRRGSGEPRAAASPVKNVRRARRRLECDGGREEAAAEEEAVGKARARKSAAAKGVAKEKKGSGLALVPCPTASRTRGKPSSNAEQSDWEGLWERVIELVMWKNVGRSAFWFGSGSMIFCSSSFSTDIEFSPIKILCNFGVVTLGLAFFKDSITQRQNTEPVRKFQLTEEDVLRVAQAVLPIANSLVSMARVIFSGDPSMTLKVLPILLFGAKYGHLLTLWRLLAIGFFGSFTLPRLYSCYSSHIREKVEGLNARILNAWKSCPRKKLVAAAAAITFWNVVSVKTRVMAAFISVATLRYYYQYGGTSKNSEKGITGQRERQQAMLMED
ncbi:reticulon-like protein B17 [Lolium rigidum]|uniref:reticulon-like protein B17 n=1 Tax=Lolium rigidum TaxID=89674 RepID=UPI001F5D8ED8|nr:reticulon-like protein B17 [Lolium rigidum]